MDGASNQSTRTISNVALSCIELFHGCLARDRNAFAKLEDDERRFWAWSNSLKVFEEPHINLDAQLKKHIQIREMVLLLLGVLKDNLSLSFNCEIPPYASNRKALEISFFGIDGSLKRLEKISTAIAHATHASLTRRVLIYAKTQDDYEEISRTFSLSIIFRYRGLGPADMPMFDIPAALIPSPDKIMAPQPLGLFLSLVKTSLVRHYRICYQRNQIQEDSRKPAQQDIKRPEVDLNRAEQRPEQPDNFPHEGFLELNPERTQSEVTSNTPTLETALFKKRLGEDASSSRSQAVKQPLSEAGAAMIPRPPKMLDGQKSGMCPICRQTLPANIFESRLSWISHVYKDIKPYVCISEDCMSNLQFFEDSSSWINHMHKTHTTHWIQYLHNTYHWICPVCHDDSPIEFLSKQDMEQNLIDHLEQSHSTVIEKSNRRHLASISGVPRHPPLNTCPICGTHHQPMSLSRSPDIPQNDETNYETKDGADSKVRDSIKATSSAKKARFEDTTVSDSGERNQSTNVDADIALQQANVRSSKPTRLTGVEKCIGDHLKGIAFNFSSRLIEDEYEDGSDDDHKSSAASKVSVESALLALTDLQSVGSKADPPQLPTAHYDGPVITDKEKEEVKLCIARNSKELLESFKWDNNLRVEDLKLSSTELENMFPDTNRKTNDRIWKGMDPRYALAYVACLFTVLELCEKSIVVIEHRMHIHEQLKLFSDALEDFPGRDLVIKPNPRGYLAAIDECASDSRAISATILASSPQHFSNDTSAAIKDKVIKIARTLWLRIVLADINGHIGDIDELEDHELPSSLPSNAQNLIKQIVFDGIQRDRDIFHAFGGRVDMYLNESIEHRDTSSTTSLFYCTVKWNEALEICYKNLSEEEVAQLEEAKTYDALLESLAHVQAEIPASIMRPLESLEPLRSFVTLLAAVLGTSTVKTAIIWGIMSLVIQAASRVQGLLPPTLEMLRDLGYDLEIFQIYDEATFAENSHLRDELLDISIEIITFWTQAIHFLRRNRYGTTASKALPQMVKKFGKLSQRIKERAQQIKMELENISVANIRSAADILGDLDRFDLLPSSINAASGLDNKAMFPCDNMPFTPNPHFSGREKELDILRSHFSDILSAKQFRSFALYGIGGVGKTQTALHFAYEQVANGVGAALWLNCETSLSIARSFFDVAEMLHLEGISEDFNSSQNRFLVLKWLRKTSVRWFMVMDNVQDLSIIRSAWPNASHGAVLVTSRNSFVSINLAANGLEVEVFQDESGSKLLTGLISRPSYSEEEMGAARQLSSRVGGLPLALVIMASQIETRNKSIAGFLQLYDEHCTLLNIEKRGIERYSNFPLASCWETAFNFITPEATKLLEIIAHVAPDNIPEELFLHSNLLEDYAFCADYWAFSEAVDQLTSTGLVRRDPATKMMYVHRLIQEGFVYYIGPERRHRSFVATSSLLNAVFPKLVNGLSMRLAWNQCKLYTSHVLLLCARYEADRYEPKVEDEFAAFLELSISVGYYLMECGAWEEEIELIRTALHICKDKNGLVYAALANLVGCTECERGHVQESHDYIEKSLEIRRKLLPPNHPEVANSLNNYANILLLNLGPGDCEKALQYYMECIDINMKCAPEHRNRFLHVPHTNIARLLRITKDYEGSIRHAELSRQYSVKSLGPGNYFTGLADYNIGNCYFDLGQYAVAESHWKFALACFLKESNTLPITSAAKFKLCTIALKREEYQLAINDLSKLLIIVQLNEKAKGDKGEIARVMRKLAEAYKMSGEMVLGTKLREEAEALRKEIQGARFSSLPDEDLSYAMMSFHAFW